MVQSYKSMMKEICKHCRKNENANDQHFFPIMFAALTKTDPVIRAIRQVLMKNAFNLDESKMFLSDK